MGTEKVFNSLIFAEIFGNKERNMYLYRVKIVFSVLGIQVRGLGTYIPRLGTQVSRLGTEKGYRNRKKNTV